MHATRRALAALTLIVLAAAISACGSSTSSSGATVSTYEKAVEFAECIRTHGDPNFSDPNSAGEFDSGIGVSPAVWQQAVDACKALEPPGSLSGNRSPKQQSAALTFAACVRTHGVPDFPDPVNGQPLVDTNHIPSANRPGGMTILNAAMQQCRSQLRLAADGQ